MGTSPNRNDPKLPLNSRFCKCAACGEYFTSDSSFIVHRVKDDSSPTGRACADPSKILDRQRKPRLRLTTTGYWASARRRVSFGAIEEIEDAGIGDK